MLAGFVFRAMAVLHGYVARRSWLSGVLGSVLGS